MRIGTRKEQGYKTDLVCFHDGGAAGDRPIFGSGLVPSFTPWVALPASPSTSPHAPTALHTFIPWPHSWWQQARAGPCDGLHGQQALPPHLPTLTNKRAPLSSGYPHLLFLFPKQHPSARTHTHLPFAHTLLRIFARLDGRDGFWRAHPLPIADGTCVFFFPICPNWSHCCWCGHIVDDDWHYFCPDLNYPLTHSAYGADFPLDQIQPLPYISVLYRVV